MARNGIWHACWALAILGVAVCGCDSRPPEKEIQRTEAMLWEDLSSQLRSPNMTQEMRIYLSDRTREAVRHLKSGKSLQVPYLVSAVLCRPKADDQPHAPGQAAGLPMYWLEWKSPVKGIVLRWEEDGHECTQRFGVFEHIEEKLKELGEEGRDYLYQMCCVRCRLVDGGAPRVEVYDNSEALLLPTDLLTKIEIAVYTCNEVVSNFVELKVMPDVLASPTSSTIPLPAAST